MENIKNQEFYFAAMNTADGFKNHFPDIFSGLDRLYIIKGGPGTGKSRLMREIAEKAKNKGFKTEGFLCSSDPTSLDGVIIPDMSLGILDGTSPHAWESVTPGAVEELVDLGRFWSSSALKSRRCEIESINKAKKRLFSSVYGYLNAIKSYDDMLLEMTKKALDINKMEREITKCADRVSITKTHGRADKKLRIRTAVSTEGVITLCTYADIAKHRYAVSDAGGCGGIFLKALLSETERRNIPCQVSCSPFRPDTPDAIFYPESEVSFYIGSEHDYDEKTINMRRFTDKAIISADRPRARAISKLRSESLSQLVTDYRCIKRLHAEIESVYAEAMDFSAKEQLSRELCKSIFNV